MNPLRIVLAASVAFNVGLLTLLVLFFSTSPPQKPASQPNREAAVLSLTGESAGAPPELEPESTAPPDARPAVPDEVAMATDLRNLYRHLRSAGLDAERARQVVTAAAMIEFQEEWQQSFSEAASREFWKNHSQGWMLDFQTEYVQRRRQMEAMLEEITGAPPPDSMTFTHLIGMENLSAEQQRTVRMIEEDYSLLQSQIHARGSTMLPEDWEALRLLHEERRQDLASVLGEEGLREYDLRNSQTSRQLRHSLRLFEPSEEEFRTIFSLKHDIDLTFGPQYGFMDQEARENRRGAEQAMNEQLRELLGEERFAEFELSQDHSFTTLAGLTDRLGLPRETARDIHQMQQLVREKQMEFQRAPDLNPDDIAEANQLLWEETRRTVEEALGEEGMEAYMNQGGWWLRNLQNQARASQPRG